MITETGQSVQQFAEEELRPEPGLVQTLLLSLVDNPVLERELIHETATPIFVEVRSIVYRCEAKIVSSHKISTPESQLNF